MVWAGESEWGGVVLVVKGIGQGCLIGQGLDGVESWCRRHTSPSGGQGYGHGLPLGKCKGVARLHTV